MNSQDTIAAISTAVGAAARMIVRMSGPRSRAIADHAEIGATRTNFSFAGMSVPTWALCFAAPRSITGEDVVELHIPGNPLLAKMLLDELLRRGARYAEPGEFTARAYFNGRIGLEEAEGVAAVIAAHSRSELAAARQLLAGELARRLQPEIESLTNLLALTEAGIDFSEEGIEFIRNAEFKVGIGEIAGHLNQLLNDSARFERLTTTPRIVLCGRPNAGKSTLLNALCGRPRAVVSPIAGTTRDVLWAEVELPRGIVQLSDIAGLDDGAPTDSISMQMRDRALRAIYSADVVVLVRDCTDQRPNLDVDRSFDVLVQTKSDLLPSSSDDRLSVSAHTGANIQELRLRLDRLCFGGDSLSSALVLNSRHVRAVEDALAAVQRAGESADTTELAAFELRAALDSLGSILGQVTPDDVLAKVFSSFCIGK